MTIDEAIKMLREAKLAGDEDYYRDLGDAIKLGIEALKAIKCGREGLRTEFYTPLLGETKD